MNGENRTVCGWAQSGVTNEKYSTLTAVHVVVNIGRSEHVAIPSAGRKVGWSCTTYRKYQQRLMDRENASPRSVKKCLTCIIVGKT